MESQRQVYFLYLNLKASQTLFLKRRAISWQRGCAYAQILTAFTCVLAFPWAFKSIPVSKVMGQYYEQ